MFGIRPVFGPTYLGDGIAHGGDFDDDFLTGTCRRRIKRHATSMECVSKSGRTFVILAVLFRLLREFNTRNVGPMILLLLLQQVVCACGGGWRRKYG